MFVWSSPFLWGFLSYWMSTALGIGGFAVWKLLEDRPRAREALFWAAVPLVFLTHAVGGCLMVLLIGAFEFGMAAKPLGYRPIPLARALLVRCRPLLVILPLIAWWRLSGQTIEGVAGPGTTWSLSSKFEEFGTILRDQYMIFDIACVLAAAAVMAIGWWRGARLAAGTGWPIAAVWIAYIALPFTSAGGSYLDMRLVPVGMILPLLLLDWRPVRSPRLVQLVLFGGLALFALRLAITTTGSVAMSAPIAAPYQP